MKYYQSLEAKIWSMDAVSETKFVKRFSAVGKLLKAVTMATNSELLNAIN